MASTRTFLFLLGLVLLAAATEVGATDRAGTEQAHTPVAPCAACKRFRHITTFKGAPKNATIVRNALMKQWNKLQPNYKCIYWAVSFAAPGDDLTAFPYNWGGFFDFKNRESYDAFRMWLIKQPSFQSTFGPINANAVRFNTCLP